MRPSSVRDACLIAGASLAAGFIPLGGCTTTPPPPQTESMRNPQADFNAFRTFGWPGDNLDSASGEPLQLLDENIRTAIRNELTRKGYAEAPAGTTPDLRIVYETASAEKIENNPVRVGVGVGSWGGNAGGSVNVGTPSIRNFKEGTLVVHAIENARNEEVWQGRMSNRITKGSVDDAAIANAVAAALRDFPVRSPQ